MIGSSLMMLKDKSCSGPSQIILKPENSGKNDKSIKNNNGESETIIVTIENNNISDPNFLLTAEHVPISSDKEKEDSPSSNLQENSNSSEKSTYRKLLSTTESTCDKKLREFVTKYKKCDNLSWITNAQSVNIFLTILKEYKEQTNKESAPETAAFIQRLTNEFKNYTILFFCTHSCSNIVIQELIKLDPVSYITFIFKEVFNTSATTALTGYCNGNEIVELWKERNRSTCIADQCLAYNTVLSFITSRYGCYVFQTVLDYIVKKEYNTVFKFIFFFLTKFFMEKKFVIAQDRYGNFVISKWIINISKTGYCPFCNPINNIYTQQEYQCNCVKLYRDQFISHFFSPSTIQVLSSSTFSSHVLEHIIDIMTEDEIIKYSCAVLQVNNLYQMFCSEPSCFVIEKFASALAKNREIQVLFIQQIKFVVTFINANIKNYIVMKETVGKNSKGKIVHSNPINSVVMKMRSLIHPIDYNLLVPISFMEYKAAVTMRLNGKTPVSLMRQANSSAVSPVIPCNNNNNNSNKSSSTNLIATQNTGAVNEDNIASNTIGSLSPGPMDNGTELKTSPKYQNNTDCNNKPTIQYTQLPSTYDTPYANYSYNPPQRQQIQQNVIGDAQFNTQGFPNIFDGSNFYFPSAKNMPPTNNTQHAEFQFHDASGSNIFIPK